MKIGETLGYRLHGQLVVTRSSSQVSQVAAVRFTSLASRYSVRSGGGRTWAPCVLPVRSAIQYQFVTRTFDRLVTKDRSGYLALLLMGGVRLKVRPSSRAVVPYSRGNAGGDVNGYQATLDAITSAGNAATDLADQLITVDLAGAMTGVPRALPGARSAKAARNLSTAWKDDIRAYGDAVREHGETLLAASTRYAANEDAAEADIRYDRTGGMRPI